MNKYLELIHRENIYKNFEPLPYQTEETNISKHLNEIFGSFKEKEVLICEVGSWKGASAIEIAHFFLNKNIIPTILCIDTWNGLSYRREHDQFFPMLKCKNGFPRLYQQFLSNIINLNLQEFIVPVPHSSHDAARYLKKLNIRADFCFIDGNHEFDESYQDIIDYWELTKTPGTLFTDDFDRGWMGVVNAVNLFVHKNNLENQCELYGSEFVIRKV